MFENTVTTPSFLKVTRTLTGVSCTLLLRDTTRMERIIAHLSLKETQSKQTLKNALPEGAYIVHVNFNKYSFTRNKCIALITISVNV